MDFGWGNRRIKIYIRENRELIKEHLIKYKRYKFLHKIDELMFEGILYNWIKSQKRMGDSGFELEMILKKMKN